MNDDLASLKVEFDADLSPLEARMNRAVSYGQSMGNRVGGAFGVGFASPILNAVSAVGQLEGGLREIARVGSSVTGLGIAATYQRLEVGFKGILGNAKQARDLMNDLAHLGAETPFRTEELTGYAQQLLSLGVNAKRVTADLEAMADATAARGGTTEGLGSLTSILSGFRVRPRLDIREIAELARYIDISKVASAGTGRNISNAMQAESILSGMTGEKAYDTIIRGIQKVYGGAARGQGADTFLGLGQNVQESVGLAMRPTGERLIAILQPLEKSLIAGANAFEQLNRVTGGGAGVVVTIAGAVLAHRLYTATVGSAVSATRNLTTAINQFATSANTAAASGGGSNAGGRVGAFGGMGRGGAIAFGVSGAAAVGGALMQNSGNGIVSRIGSYLGSAGTFASMGAGIGSIFPGIGTAIGAAVGAAVGLGVAGYQHYQDAHPKKEAAGSAADRTANATEAAAVALQQIRSQLVGGGARARGATSQVEREYAVYQIMRGAATGIG